MRIADRPYLTQTGMTSATSDHAPDGKVNSRKAPAAYAGSAGGLTQFTVCPCVRLPQAPHVNDVPPEGTQIRAFTVPEFTTPVNSEEDSFETGHSPDIVMWQEAD